MPLSKKMKIISVLLSLLLLASVNKAMAEHWKLVEKGDYIELYSDSDYYHQNQENGLEYSSDSIQQMNTVLGMMCQFPLESKKRKSKEKAPEL